MGTEIINAIKSGLGLIKDLASEFLDGFETLVWVPADGNVAGHLTSVGTFCLVFLGVSISFAVVRLILNLLRGNTGA